MNDIILIKAFQDGYDQYEGVGPKFDEPFGIGDVIAWVSLAFLILLVIYIINEFQKKGYREGYKDRDDEDKSDEEKIRYPW